MKNMEKKLKNAMSKKLDDMLTSTLMCIEKEFSLFPKWLEEDKSSLYKDSVRSILL